MVERFRGWRKTWAIVGIASRPLDEGSPDPDEMSCCSARSVSEELPEVRDTLPPSGAGWKIMVSEANKG